MSRFIKGETRSQLTLMPECLEDYIGSDNPVRVVDAFVEALDLTQMGFEAVAASTGRPGYHPGLLLKIYIYGYLNRIQSSRRLERESARNVELMWLTGRLSPDFKTIADFRRDKVVRSAMCAAGLLHYAVSLICSAMPRWPLMGASLKPSIIGIRISPRISWPCE